MNTTSGLFRYQQHQAPSYSADLVQLKKMEIGDSSTVFVVRINKGVLECVLSGDGWPEQRVELAKFSFIDRKWQHVSCWFEGFDISAETGQGTDGQGADEDWLASKNLLQGSLYSDG